jgi:hypothetical protein
LEAIASAEQRALEKPLGAPPPQAAAAASFVEAAALGDGAALVRAMRVLRGDDAAENAAAAQAEQLRRDAQAGFSQGPPARQASLAAIVACPEAEGMCLQWEIAAKGRAPGRGSGDASVPSTRVLSPYRCALGGVGVCRKTTGITRIGDGGDKSDRGGRVSGGTGLGSPLSSDGRARRFPRRRRPRQRSRRGRRVCRPTSGRRCGSGPTAARRAGRGSRPLKKRKHASNPTTTRPRIRCASCSASRTATPLLRGPWSAVPAPRRCRRPDCLVAAEGERIVRPPPRTAAGEGGGW